MVDPNTAAASTQVWSRLGQAEAPRVERMTCAAQGWAFELITLLPLYPGMPGSHGTPAARRDDERFSAGSASAIVL